ncbi:MAG TPA: chromophore lyase CpcT/CpeT [Planctomycetota bacterium]|nr:chromophore lyase CpcT/CpeT [Planctomycetota bacterium]
MPSRLTIAFWLAGAALFQSCASGPAAVSLDEVARWFSGSYSNRKQAELLPQDFDEQRLTVVRVWEGRGDGPWLYARFETKDGRLLRHCVYRLRSDGDQRGLRVVLEVYDVPGDPGRFAGIAAHPEHFVSLRREDLTLVEPCSITLLKQQGAWVGGTQGRACAERPGAKYTTRIVRLFEDRFESWLRGFDARGEQVFGATAGAHVFDKTSGKIEGS